MICNRCHKEIKARTYVVDMHEGVEIGYMHMACFNRMFKPEEEDDGEIED